MFETTLAANVFAPELKLAVSARSLPRGSGDGVGVGLGPTGGGGGGGGGEGGAGVAVAVGLGVAGGGGGGVGGFGGLGVAVGVGVGGVTWVRHAPLEPTKAAILFVLVVEKEVAAGFSAGAMSVTTPLVS